MPRADDLATLAASAYAHRGLHDSTVPENSLAAFSAAIEAGLGIECDIRKSSDGRAMVFHDEDLERLTGRAGRMGQRSVGDLTAITLTDSEERIPTLRDALDLVAGRVPLLLEIKIDDTRPVEPICRAVRRDLDGYLGPVGVMSFDPRVAQWFAKNDPERLRGVVVTDQTSRTLAATMLLRRLITRAEPDFLALDIRDLPGSYAAKQAAKGRQLFTWTVRTAAQVDTARDVGAVPILEGAGVAAWKADT